MYSRKYTYWTTLIFMIVIATTALSQSIAVDENVPVSFSVLPPAVPGDPPVSTYENTMGDIELEMDGGNKWAFGTTWYVTVYKSTTSWDPNLKLDVYRDPSRTDPTRGR